MPHQTPLVGTPQPKLAAIQANPVFAPVTLNQIKQQLKIPLSQSDHDVELQDVLDQAIATVQADTSYIGADSTWEWYPLFLVKKTPLPFYNVTSITSVERTIIDPDPPNEQILDPVLAADYSLDLTKLRPELSRQDQDTDWPEPTVRAVNPWKIVFQAGAAQGAITTPETEAENVRKEFEQQVKSIVSRVWQGDESIEDLGEVYRALGGRDYATYL